MKYKPEINEYFYLKTRFTKAGKLNMIGGVGDTDDDNSANPLEAGYEGSQLPDGDDWESPLLAEIMALVKGNIHKKGKGKGRNKGKGDDATKAGKSNDVEMGASAGAEDKKCFECGQPFSVCKHLARDCPVRQQRVAAGGPARLPKGGGKGKGKSAAQGKGQWPTRERWNQYYPGPSQAQWKQWFPAAPSAPNKASLFQSPFQLSSMSQQNGPESPIDALFNTPGSWYSCVRKGPKPQEAVVRPGISLQNKYDTLTDADEDSSPRAKPRITMEVPIEAALKPESRNQAKREKKKKGK